MDEVESIYGKDALVVEGEITKEGSYGYLNPVRVDDIPIDNILTDHFGPWQLRSFGDALPGGNYRITVERLED